MRGITDWKREEAPAQLAREARNIRISILKMLHQAGSGHTGGSLSAADLMTALFLGELRHKPGAPDWEERDRFVLSKGHAAPVYYAVLCRCAYLEQKELCCLRKSCAMLQGHPDCKSTPGIEVSTGSLGQGLSIANGMALGLRLNKSSARVYALMGDGEVQEGMIWEAAMTAAHYKLDNLCAILDKNGLQIDGSVQNIMGIEPLDDKWRAFGWHVIHINGHKFNEILNAFDSAREVKGQPVIIIADTIKGKGVSIFENKVEYHGKAPNDKEFELAMKELTENEGETL
ncbi:MAG: transketolase [Pseudomonadota bacterium]